MKALLCILMTLATLAVAAIAHAARVEVTASEIATIQPQDSTLSPRILVKWALPDGLADKDIDAAFVEMTVAVNGDGPLVLDMIPLARSWSASALSGASRWAEEGHDWDTKWPATVVATATNGGSVTMDVRQMVREIAASNRSNYGFILIPDSSSEVKLGSFETNSSAKLADARLVIVYRDRRTAR